MFPFCGCRSPSDHGVVTVLCPFPTSKNRLFLSQAPTRWPSRSPIVGLSDRTFEALPPSSYIAKARKVAHRSSLGGRILYISPFSISNMHVEERNWKTICGSIEWHWRSRPAANRGASAAGIKSRNVAVEHCQQCIAVVSKALEIPGYCHLCRILNSSNTELCGASAGFS